MPGVPNEGPLSTAAAVVIANICSFDPDSALILLSVSRRLAQNVRIHLQHHAEAVARCCSNMDSSLSSRINGNLAAIRHVLGPQSDRVTIRFLSSIPRIIRSLGISPKNCPDRILSLQEIQRFNAEIEDTNLLATGLLARVTAGFPVTGLIPGIKNLPAWLWSAHEVRTWVQGGENRTLMTVPKLQMANRELRCVPKEIALCTGLRELLLGNNRLVCLPDGLFRRMGALQFLDLSNNQLEFLPEGSFQGLTSLHTLDLQSNRLVSLPRGLFDGLSQLQLLYLRDNPQLLISCQELPAVRLTDQGELFSSDVVVNNIAVREKMQKFFSYACRSPFAVFYQFAAGCSSPEGVRESFSGLDGTIRNAIFGKVWEEAGRPKTGDPQWGERHAFDSMPIFGGALKRYVTDSFKQLSSNQKNTVYGHVFTLARSQNGAQDTDFNDPQSGSDYVSRHFYGLLSHVHPAAGRKGSPQEINFKDWQWGKNHAHDNVPTLIDAMTRLSRPEEH